MTDAADKIDALVVGGGPAGLAAAEALSSAGRSVVVAEAMPSVGRKFLMAGKSGLNLTKDQPVPAFNAQYHGGDAGFAHIMDRFGSAQMQAWATGLGQELFAGSTGRVFPVAMKASPLLRAWLARLDGAGVARRTRWRWTGWDDGAWLFDTPEGPRRLAPKVAVLALGGASWRRLGSDGAWADIFAEHGIPTTPFQPANMGFRVEWSDHMAPHFGQPVKATRLSAGDLQSRGEWVITKDGMEGGGVYEVSRAVREGVELRADLMPDLTPDDIARRLARPRGKASLSNHIRKALRLDPLHRALLMEWGRPLAENATSLAQQVKALPVPVQGPMPLDQAISTAGGVAWDALTGLMLTSRPGTFVAGEMLDWEAPTGGYLLTACLATGFAAGEAAVRWSAS